MKWISIKEQIPNNERRVLVCLGYYLLGEPKGKKYHYWISVGQYCESRGWIVKENPSFDPVVFWKELPELPNEISDQPERSKREDLENCTNIQHGQNDRMEFFVACQPCKQPEKSCNECRKFCVSCNGKRF